MTNKATHRPLLCPFSKPFLGFSLLFPLLFGWQWRWGKHFFLVSSKWQLHRWWPTICSKSRPWIIFSHFLSMCLSRHNYCCSKRHRYIPLCIPSIRSMLWTFLLPPVTNWLVVVSFLPFIWWTIFIKLFLKLFFFVQGWNPSRISY